MTSPQTTGHDNPARAFLVERYLPAAAAKDLLASTARAARLCADSSGTDTAVSYLYSAYLATDDTCFCLFLGPSAAAVRGLNEQADFPLDRVTEAALVICTQ